MIFVASALIFAVAYLLGSIPFGLLLAQAFGLGDLRKIGSGNIGATNVLRTGSKSIALATVLLDAGKTILAVVLVYRLQATDLPTETWWPAMAAFAACLGHCYPVWLKFKGGKAVASFLGVWLALLWWGGLALCLVWLLVALIWRTSSLAALSAAFAAPILVFGEWGTLVFATAISALIWWRHRENLSRLRAGTEPKIGS